MKTSPSGTARAASTRRAVRDGRANRVADRDFNCTHLDERGATGATRSVERSLNGRQTPSTHRRTRMPSRRRAAPAISVERCIDGPVFLRLNDSDAAAKTATW
jgi:hypothetical protein